MRDNVNDLSLQVGGDSWLLYCERCLDESFEQYAKKVLDRDSNTCVYCGFSSSVGMLVVNKDHDYRNNKLSNLATACPFCQQCHFIEVVGKLQSGGGQMIYLPEVSQAQLNAVCHVFYASIVNGSQHARQADAYIQSLKLRSTTVEKQFGANMSDPAFMGQMLIDTPLTAMDARQIQVLENVRLLPALDHFEDQILYWAQTALNA